MRFCLYSGKLKTIHLNADLWSMKAMFEDYFETALPPKKIIGLPIPPMPSS